MDGWRDIATAPKDGTKFDAWRVRLEYGTSEHFGGERVANVWWDRPYFGSDNSKEEEAWVHQPSRWCENAEPTSSYRLTHWRPLPEPPESTP